VSNDDGEVHPRSLAGATVLQIVPALREEPVARTALNVAAALRQADARALVAAEEGPLVTELTASGGEWVPLVNDTINPFRLKRSARALERLIASERIDIVHAQSAGGAWVASMAAARITVWLVTTLLDVPPASNLYAYWAAALARGDWVITPSNFAAAPVIARHNIPAERLTIIPRSIDIAAFDPAALDAARVEALRKAWRIPHAARILLVPGRVASWNGQLILPDVARIMVDSGVRGFVFVLAGERRSHRKYAQAVMDEAQAKGSADGDPADRALPRHAGGACRCRYGGGSRNRASDPGPRGGASASHGPAGGHVQCRHFAGTRSCAAGNARRGAYGMGGPAWQCARVCPRAQRGVCPRR